MPVPEREAQPPSSTSAPVPSSLSMKELLASCAAASAVSTPPRQPASTEAPADTEAGEAEEKTPDRRHHAA
jgi:hypothetical protein